MNNKIIRTDSAWYKIKKFFQEFFTRKSKENLNEIKKNEEISNKISSNIKKDFNELQTKIILAQKLLTKEITSSELSDEQIEEMIEYFTNDIQNIDKELLRIRNHILDMKEKLTEN